MLGLDLLHFGGVLLAQFRERMLLVSFEAVTQDHDPVGDTVQNCTEIRCRNLRDFKSIVAALVTSVKALQAAEPHRHHVVTDSPGVPAVTRRAALKFVDVWR